jgi:tetratricopeptide (TPR) repeat protein
LLLLVAVLVVLGTATAALHAVQARRQSTGVRKQAEDAARAAEADPAKLDQAIALYERYLRFQPRDEEAARKYTDMIFARAKADPTPASLDKAMRVAEAFLRNSPNNPPQRRHLIGLYMKYGPLALARQHLGVFLDPDRGTHKDDVELLDMSATCEVGFQEFGNAAAYLQRAIDTGRAPLKVYVMALEVNQKNTTDTLRESKIAAIMETLLRSERFRNDVSARVAAGRFQLGRGELKNARQNILFALNDMPGGQSNSDALEAAAHLAVTDAEKNPDKSADYLTLAESHLEKAFALDPRNTSVALLLAGVKRDLTKLPEAVAVLRRAADATGEVNDAFFQVIDMMIDLEQAGPAESLLPRLATNDPKLTMTRYFRGRIAVVRKNWADARALLEVVEKELTARPLKDYHKKALVGLGLCYTVLQNPDRQLLCYVEALKDDPLYLPAMVGHAEALAKLGRTDEALLGRPNEGRPGFRALVNNYKVAAARPTLVRLEFLHAVRRPAARNWAAFDEALGPPEQRTPETHLLHAEALAARGQAADAAKLLDELLAKFPNYPAAWVALARIKHAWHADPALAELDAAEKRSGETAETRLARASLLPARAKKPTADEYRKLATGIEKFKPGDLHRFWFQLGEAALRAVAVQPTPEAAADVRSVAITCFQEAAKTDALDLTSRAILVDLGQTAKRQDVIDAAIAGIAKIEGPEGPIGNLSQVVVRLPGAKGNPAEIAALREKAMKVRDARQGWGRVYLALAQLDELSGRNDDALANYRKAIDHGERTEFVIRRTVELLWAQKKDDEAYRLLNSLYTEVPLPDDLERFRAIKDLLARDLPRSERPTIERIAPADAADYRLLLLRGSLLAAIGEDADALKAFRLAVDRDDTVPETWASLVTHLVRGGKLDEAKEAVAQGERKLKNNPPPTVAKKGDLTLALAECYEIVGDRRTAGERYQQAVELQPRELGPNRQLVFFLERSGQAEAAERMLEKLSADPAPDLSRWARRHYATILIAGPNGYDRRHKALALVEQNLKSGPADPEDVKARAAVLTIDPDTRKEGEKTLKEFADRGDLTPDEYYMLARLYFDSGRVVESVEYFAIAARPRQGVTAEHLAGLVRAHLALADKKNSTDLTAAERALERLKAMAPRSWEATREEARLLHRKALNATKARETDQAREFDDRAKKLVADFPGGQTEAMIPVLTGPLLEELGFAAEAEALYRKLLEVSKSPVAHRSLAVFLIRQKRSAEAIALARKYEPGCPVLLTAGILSGAVRVNSPGPAAEQEVLDWLDARIKVVEARADGRPVLAALVGNRALVFDGQGRSDRAKYDHAIAEYRRALSLAPSDLVTNNLAMLIALQRPDQVREAIDLMNKLIGVRGPAPEYLDTRAVCYLVAGGAFKLTEPDGKEVDGPELARRDLEMAILQHRQPAHLFHLAWAYQLKGDQAQLLLRMTDALKEGVTPEMVHPLELPKFRELSALAGK